MDKMRVVGGTPLKGKILASGSKNAALPILFSCLLTDKLCTFKKVAQLQDIVTTLKVLEELGVRWEETQAGTLHQPRVLQLQAEKLVRLEANYELVRKMRASVLTLGPLVTRMGYAKVSLPGGCAIGARPIQFHLEGLKKLGAEVELEEGYVIAKARKLVGTKIVLDFPSVGATENLMMAASLARGETVLKNTAQEPEIVDLARALRKMGVEIEGEGTSEIHIQGQTALSGCDYEIMADRIVTGTYLAAAFATKGSVTVEGFDPQWLKAVLEKFKEAGASIKMTSNSVTLSATDRPRATEMTTEPYPGFPTDMQAQFMAIMTLAKGTSRITETIFENRFMHVQELLRMGADIRIQGNTAHVQGQEFLKAAPVMATDLRASASLVIAALCARGETTINRIYHLDRGYEKLDEKLRSLGAEIERVA